MGKKHGEEKRLQCPSCGKTIALNSMKPVFKKEYTGPGGKLDIPFDVLIRGGWLRKTLEGTACPECGEIIGR